MTIKKIALSAITLSILISGVSSCKKCYTCAYMGYQNGKYCTNDYTPTQLAIYDSSCVQNGYVWTPYTN